MRSFFDKKVLFIYYQIVITSQADVELAILPKFLGWIARVNAHNMILPLDVDG